MTAEYAELLNEGGGDEARIAARSATVTAIRHGPRT